jgi:hypothetical protein
MSPSPTTAAVTSATASPQMSGTPVSTTDRLIDEHRERVAIVKARLDERLADGLVVPARELSQLLGLELHLARLERIQRIRHATIVRTE